MLEYDYGAEVGLNEKEDSIVLNMNASAIYGGNYTIEVVVRPKLENEDERHV